MVCMWSWAACFHPVAGYAQAVDSTRNATRMFINQAQEARDENAQKLRTAFGAGRLKYVVTEPNEEIPVTVLDADLQIFYDAPKYRVHLLYDQKLSENVRPSGQNGEEVQKWLPSNVAEQVVIYDGEQIFSVEFFRDNSCLGTIYFGFAKMAVMRSAGFPFEDPVNLWSQALNVESLDLANTSITPIDDGGCVGLLSKNTYQMKFFFLDDFGYDLRRVSSYRTGETQPFRDFLLSWGKSNGAHYVQRFANTVTSANGDTGSTAQTKRKLSVEYDQFQANIDIAPEVFTLSSVPMPNGTQFLDKRSSVEGGPRELVFRDSQLVELNGNTAATRK